MLSFSDIDPFNSPVQKDVSNDERKVVLKKLDDVLMNLNPGTKTKIYCGCTNEYGGDPNTHCCPVCTGMPGALPVLNEKVGIFL